MDVCSHKGKHILEIKSNKMWKINHFFTLESLIAKMCLHTKINCWDKTHTCKTSRNGVNHARIYKWLYEKHHKLVLSMKVWKFIKWKWWIDSENKM